MQPGRLLTVASSARSEQATEEVASGLKLPKPKRAKGSAWTAQGKCFPRLELR